MMPSLELPFPVKVDSLSTDDTILHTISLREIRGLIMRSNSVFRHRLTQLELDLLAYWTGLLGAYESLPGLHPDTTYHYRTKDGILQQRHPIMWNTTLKESELIRK